MRTSLSCSPLSTLTFLLAVLTTHLALASSTLRNPIGAIATVRNATIHTHSHRITALSAFDLSFIIKDELHVKLSLEPNHDILASDAVVTYMAPDGSVVRSEPVERLEHKVFRGTAWVQRVKAGVKKGETVDEGGWRQAGWARVTVHRDGRVPFFEGAFAVDFVNHHVQSAEQYAQTRHRLDPEIEVAKDGEEYMILWRDSDILPDVQAHQDLKRRMEMKMLDDDEEEEVPNCQADGLSFNSRADHPVFAGMKRDAKGFGVMDFPSLFGKRQSIDGTTGGNGAGVNLENSIGSTAGCPSTRKVALVGVATDCTYTSSFNSTESLRANVIATMNTASQIYESTFSISLGLKNLQISDASCPGTPAEATKWNQACSDSVDISARLNYFSAWRGTQQDSNSHWTLLSTCNTGSAVGLAWLGQACVQEAQTMNGSDSGSGSSGSSEQTVSGANVVIRTQGANEWQILAHETGHTFGAVHDCTDQTCANANIVNSQQCCPLSKDVCDADAQYIMNPSANQGINKFSPCSIGNICSAMGRSSVKTACFSDNKQVSTISGQQCGNGIVEPGEECDCGGEAGCGDNNCCDAKSCKFKNNAVCDDSNEDCCNNCQLANNGTVCRASTGDCDPQETCSGSSATCPKDVTSPDGDSCGKHLQCISGQCTSRDQQCKTVMGSYTEGNDTSSCDSSGCQISCASPEFGPGVCYGLRQNFLDGTPCGGDGRCNNGQCKGSSVGGQIKSWIDTHKTVVIAVCSVIGALLLFAIVGCISRSCRRKRQNKKANRPMPPVAQGWGGWNGQRGGNGGGPGGAPQPPMMSHPTQGWYDNANANMSGGNGNGGSHWGGSQAPVPPPPAYGQGGGGGGGGGQSTRWA